MKFHSHKKKKKKILFFFPLQVEGIFLFPVLDASNETFLLVFSCQRVSLFVYYAVVKGTHIPKSTVHAGGSIPPTLLLRRLVADKTKTCRKTLTCLNVPSSSCFCGSLSVCLPPFSCFPASVASQSSSWIISTMLDLFPSSSQEAPKQLYGKMW